MAEATFADLQSAIRGFNDQVQSYAIQSAVNNASQQVQQLQNAQLDEIEKRNQTQQLSQQLALQLTGLGANASQVQTAMAATAPKPLNDFGSMFAEGLMTGSEPLKQKATELKKFMNEDKFAMAKLKLDQDRLKLESKQTMLTDTKFQNLVPKVQENYNRAIKVLNEKIGQINLIEGLPTGAPKDRVDLTTIVKSVGQDVGAIGDKEADAVLPPSMASQFKSFRNYITGNADSIRTKEQADAMKKVFKQAKPLLKKIIEARGRQYAYQLSKSAKVMGHTLNLNEAMELLAEPSFEGGSSNSALQPSRGSSPTAPQQPAAPAFDINEFLTPVQSNPGSRD